MLRVVIAILILGLGCLPAAEAAAERALAAARLASDRYQHHVEDLVRKLEHADPEIRDQAFRSLGRTRDPQVVPHLLPYLDADLRSEAEVVAATQALATLGATSATPALQKLTRRDEQAVRVAALNALAQLERLQPFDYERESAAEDGDLRAMGVTDLGTLVVEDAGPILVSALRDRRDHIRRMAAIGLGRLGDVRYAEAVTEALTDRDPLVRRYAAETLTILDHKPAIPYLLMALEAGIASGDVNRALIALSGEDFGFHPRANEVANKLAVDRGFEWWSLNASRFTD